MKYELFNTTNSVREVPKYNYKGVITLQPKGTYPIEEFMTKFYLPYVPSGIAIRTTEDVVENKEASTIVEKVEEVKAFGVKVADEKVEDGKVEDEKVADEKVEEKVDATEVEAVEESEETVVEKKKPAQKRGRYNKK